MTKEALAGEISSDGRTLIFRSPDGNVKWSRSAPTVADWCRLTERSIDSDVEAGRFQYIQYETSRVIIAVFTPYRGLDFNLTYATATGELIRIDEAR